jgi:hypothetical protein
MLKKITIIAFIGDLVILDFLLLEKLVSSNALIASSFMSEFFLISQEI